MKEEDFYTVRGYEILGKEKHALTDSMEDYLEMIARHVSSGEFVRINVLAESLNVQAPSATKMVQKLAVLGLVSYEKYGFVKLTPKGQEIGAFLLHRHKVIDDFFSLLEVNRDKLKHVELIEHHVTADVLIKIKALNEFFQIRPDILAEFREYETKIKNNYD